MPDNMYCGKQPVHNALVGVRCCFHKQLQPAIALRQEILRAAPQEKGLRNNGA